MVRNRFWVRWIEVLGGVILAFGALLAIAGGTDVCRPLNELINPSFWGDEGLSAASKDFQTWIYALLGATMMGWGIAVVALARFGLGNGLRWAWWSLVIGIAGWYVLDTAASVIAGVWFNVALNTVILVAAAIPLVALRGLRPPA